MNRISNIIFKTSLGTIVFIVVILALKYFRNISINFNIIPYCLAIIVSSLMFSLLSGQFKRFGIIVTSGILVYILFFFILMETEYASKTLPVNNSNYLLKAEMGTYQILEQNFFYTKPIAQKSSRIFFTPNMKTGVVTSFQTKFITETPDYIVLEIKGIYNKPVKNDTIQKLK